MSSVCLLSVSESQRAHLTREVRTCQRRQNNNLAIKQSQRLCSSRAVDNIPVCVMDNPQRLSSSFLPSFLLSQYTWESVPRTYTQKSVSLGENPEKLYPTFFLCIHRKLYLRYIIHQDLMFTTLFDLLWQKVQKRIDTFHRYVIPESGGYILQQSEHCKSTILQHSIGMTLKRRKEKQCLLYSPRPP